MRPQTWVHIPRSEGWVMRPQSWVHIPRSEALGDAPSVLGTHSKKRGVV